MSKAAPLRFVSNCAASIAFASHFEQWPSTFLPLPDGYSGPIPQQILHRSKLALHRLVRIHFGVKCSGSEEREDEEE
jgi:hypothetical protein